MKKIIPLLSSLFFVLSTGLLHGQISLLQTDAPAVGDVFIESSDTTLSAYTIGQSGPNRIWDFRNLLVMESDTLTFIATNDAPRAESFPNASIVGKIDSVYTFAIANNEGLFFLGIVSDFFDVDTFYALKFDLAPKLLAYPTTSTTSFIDTSKFDVSEFSSVFGDSVRIVQEEVHQVNVDAFGTLRMPSGNFNVLRQKRMIISYDTIEVRNNGLWFPIQAGTDTSYTYEWLAKESKGPLLTISTNAAGTITDINFVSNIIPNIPAPQAAFAVEDREDGSFRFVDQSTNEPNSWAWDFGDGATSTEQNPTHVYASTGSFNVCLTASNNTGSSMVCQTVEVFLPPVATFDIDTIGNGTFVFNDLSSNSPISWDWDFGDGSTSDNQNPTHTFNIPGTFEICLTATNEAGQNTSCQSLTVVLIPTANFEIVGIDNNRFMFNDLSGNNPNSWFWNFGDGNTSNEQSPTHMYSAPGSYEVCLSAANVAGSSNVCKTLSVVFAPVASFDIDTLDNGLYEFTDLSTNVPTSWAWDFGDGSTSNSQNPSHAFTASGDFQVCLMVSNEAGSGNTCQTISVLIDAVDDIEKGLKLKLFPNPVAQSLAVQIERTLVQDAFMQIINMQGQTRLRQVVNSNANIDVTSWPSGHYTLLLYSPQGAIIGRKGFIVNH